LKNSKRLASGILAISTVLLVLGFAIVTVGPKYGKLESSKSCPYGGTYYAQIFTSLCGWQYDVCVSLDSNCGNDYHPEQVVRYYPVYGGLAGLLGLSGLVGLTLGVLVFARQRRIRTRFGRATRRELKRVGG